jgi:aspartyl protease family protein
LLTLTRSGVTGGEAGRPENQNGFRGYGMKARSAVVTGMTAALLLTVATAFAAVPKIRVQALFENKALFTIDGNRRLLKVGEVSPEGVRLIATDTRSERMIVERDGRQEVLVLGVVMMPRVDNDPVDAALNASVVLQAQDKHFYADGAINGKKTRFLVDTGATVVTLSGNDARRLGIAYVGSTNRAEASTAGGDVSTYMVNLERLQVGSIELTNVEASIIEGRFPKEPLLGMSALGQLNVRHDGERMELSKR